MIKWVSADEPNNIPVYPFTSIGVGGLVIDSCNRVLVIQEKYSVGGKKQWKLPGGVSHQGEAISMTAEREVWEETGIRGSFQSILTIRHLHEYQFGCADLYIVCLLTVDESCPDALKLNKCDHEIDAVQWMPLEEAEQVMSPHNRFVIDKYRLSQRTGCAIRASEVDFILGGTTTVYALQTQDNP